MNKPDINPDYLTKSSIREYYEDLYRSKHIRNPAVKIYDRLRIENIKSIANTIDGTILIVGCGSNLDVSLVDNFKIAYIFDISYHAVKTNYYNGLNTFTADALNIPLPSQSIDLIICSEVLEHIPQINIALREFSRILTPNGNLIVSSPNWFSLFGIVRLLSEKVLRRSFHSYDQPYDDWKSYWKYKRELRPWFKPETVRGIWYLPPLHYKDKGLSERWVKLLFFFYKPFEKLFSRIFPIFGHLILINCKHIKQNAD